MSERWYRAFGAEDKEQLFDELPAHMRPDLMKALGGDSDYTPTPHSAEYNSYFPFPPDNSYGLGPPPPAGSPLGTPAHEIRSTWEQESRRRRNANRDALTALRAGAEAGHCEPCEALTLIYDEDRRGQSEWYAANPVLATRVSMLPVPTVPDACLSCTPQPAGWTPQDDLTPEQLVAALTRPRPKAAPNLPVIIGVTAVGTLLLSRWLFRE